MDNPDPQAEGNDRYFGYSMDLIKEIAKDLNITFKFMITKDNAYPYLQEDLIARVSKVAIK